MHAGGAFVLHELGTQTVTCVHDQRWRERPRPDGLGSLVRQDSGVVHAIVGCPTATPTPAGTAAQSAASILCSQQIAAIQTLAQSMRSWSHQG